jgi:hypothetical protein
MSLLLRVTTAGEEVDQWLKFQLKSALLIDLTIGIR